MTDDNPFNVEDDESENEVEAGDDNKSFAELRKAYKARDRQVKALEKELEPLREFKTTVVAEQRSAQMETVFKEVGLSPKHAELFNKVEPEAEVTAEAVKAFAAQYDLITPNGEAVEAPAQKPAGFSPVTTGSAPAVGQLTHSDIKEMLNRGEIDAVNKAYEQGRVIKEPTPWVVPS